MIKNRVIHMTCRSGTAINKNSKPLYYLYFQQKRVNEKNIN